MHVRNHRMRITWQISDPSANIAPGSPVSRQQQQVLAVSVDDLLLTRAWLPGRCEPTRKLTHRETPMFQFCTFPTSSSEGREEGQQVEGIVLGCRFEGHRL